MKRGEIWTVAGGFDYAGKPRPAVIVQADILSDVGSVTLCGFTGVVSESPTLRPLITANADNGLRKSSRVMVDKISTLYRHRLGQRLGTLSAQDLARVDEALILFLGLGG
jgi:mRNA interferase MazF